MGWWGSRVLNFLVKIHAMFICSVTNSSSGLIFVKIRAGSGRIYSKNPVKIRAKVKFCDVVVFLRFRARSERYFAI